MGKTGSMARVATAGLLAFALSFPLESASPAVDAAFAKFWDAASPADAKSAADAIAASGVTFDEAFALLRKGRAHSANVPRGVVRLTHRLEDIDFAYLLDVPETYDPAKRYQVRFQLHGGVSRPDPTQRGSGIGALAGVEQIYVLPTGWSDAQWWTDAQIENLRSILDRLKRTYNVDENRVVLSGVSDGGTGAYYFANRNTTPFAAFLPLNGAVAVLGSSSVRVDGDVYLNNFLNKPFFIVNGGRDPLYPPMIVAPYVQQMIRGGVVATYLPQPEAGHNTAWWPEVKDTFETFVREHPRNPLPDTLTWESDLVAGSGRAHWLMIDALAKSAVDTPPLPDIGDVVGPPVPDFGMQTLGTRVTRVTAGGNAERFGLRAGDIMLKIDEREIVTGVDALQLLAITEPKTPLTFMVSRDGVTRALPGVFDPAIAPRVTPLFYRHQPSGRVDLVRQGNTITATTRRVAEFTLLLSPDVFDFSKPVVVVADGRTVFEERVVASAATLVKWAARDNDRTMLFGAEVKVKLIP